MLASTTPLFHAMGLWAVALERAFGWNRTKLSIALTLTRVEGGILGPAEGYLIDKIGTKRMVFVGMLIMGLGWVLFSRINGLTLFYVSYLVIALGQGIGGWLALNTMINNWFIKYRSIAMGMGSAVGRLGSLLLIPVLAWMMDPDFPERMGWSNTALLIGVVIIVVSFPLTRLLRNRPEEYGLSPDGIASLDADVTDGSGASPSQHSPDFTVSQALREPSFWFIGIGHGLVSMVLLALMLHLAPMMTDIGYGLQTGAYVVSAYTAISMVFQIVGGYLGDRMPKNVALMIFSLFQAASVFLLTFGPPNLLVAYGFAILFGMGFGGRSPISSAIRGDYFGRKNYGTIMGISQVPMNVFLLVGPVLAGVIRDWQGDYKIAFAVLGCCATLGAFCFLFAVKPKNLASR